MLDRGSASQSISAIPAAHRTALANDHRPGTRTRAIQVQRETSMKADNCSSIQHCRREGVPDVSHVSYVCKVLTVVLQHARRAGPRPATEDGRGCLVRPEFGTEGDGESHQEEYLRPTRLPERRCTHSVPIQGQVWIACAFYGRTTAREETARMCGRQGAWDV